MKQINGCAAALAFAALTALAAPSQAAVSVVLECMSDPSKGPDIAGVHTLYEVDYDAGTVRVHSVNDDGEPAAMGGSPFMDSTYRAEMSDREIKWTEQMMAGPIYMTLGRYSAELQSDFVMRGQPEHTGRQGCRPWTPTHQTRQF